MTPPQTSNCKDDTEPHNFCSTNSVGASHVKTAGRRLKLDFLFHKVSAAHSAVAFVWPVWGPHLNTGLPHGQQLVSRFLGLRAVLWEPEKDVFQWAGSAAVLQLHGGPRSCLGSRSSCPSEPTWAEGLAELQRRPPACQGRAQQPHGVLTSCFPVS